jgi:hypothetical protein
MSDPAPNPTFASLSISVSQSAPDSVPVLAPASTSVSAPASAVASTSAAVFHICDYTNVDEHVKFRSFDPWADIIKTKTKNKVVVAQHQFKSPLKSLGPNVGPKVKGLGFGADRGLYHRFIAMELQDKDDVEDKCAVSFEKGEFHDQGDANWIVIRRPLWGHNNMPCGWPAPARAIGRPGSGPPQGVMGGFSYYRVIHLNW